MRGAHQTQRQPLTCRISWRDHVSVEYIQNEHVKTGYKPQGALQFRLRAFYLMEQPISLTIHKGWLKNMKKRLSYYRPCNKTYNRHQLLLLSCMDYRLDQKCFSSVVHRCETTSLETMTTPYKSIINCIPCQDTVKWKKFRGINFIFFGSR